MISFIVVTYQRGERLQACLGSIYQQVDVPRPFEIVVIDNGGDAVIVPPDDPQIHLHVEVSGENLGAAGGRNRGMEIAQGDLWIFIDDDAVWHDRQDAARILRVFEQIPACGMVALKSLDPLEHQPIIRELPYPDKAYLLRQKAYTDIPYFYAYGYAVRREVIQKTGGYPPRFGIYAEELDLSLRVIDAGYRIIYEPDAAVIHYQAQQGRPVYGQRYWQANALNKSRMAWRLLPHPYPITTTLAWSFKTFYKTRSLRSVLGIWRDLWRERKLLQQERKPVRAETISYLKRIGARLRY